MTKILGILTEFVKEIEKNNPFNLVLKGGTSLSLYYLDHHRESEDLDFDADKNLIYKHKEIEKYFVDILNKLKQKHIIDDYKITKAGFASTNRYHIKLELKTHKIFYTKMDIDFIELPKNLIQKGCLCLYSTERIFITKALAFINRKEFKDMYDISYLAEKIDTALFKKKENVVLLIQNIIEIMQQDDMKELYKSAFRNADLRFKSLKEPGLDIFIQNTIRKLNILVNKLRKK